MSEPLDELFSLPSSAREFDLQAARLACALMSQELRNQKKCFDEFKANVEENYTLKSAVSLPIKLIYSTAAAVLLAFMGALVSLVMKGHP